MGYREDIVAYCQDNIGCSYDYTPSGGVEGESYNCSFLSFCAYKAAGLEIPTWQGHQNGNGSQSDWVRWSDHWTDEPSKLLAGDLVFFSTDDDPYDTYHVGVSLGGSMMIDSVPKGGVQVRTLYDTFVGGGWPFERLPEDKEQEDGDMNVIIEITDKNTAVWLANDVIHDLSDPDDIKALDAAWSAGHDGAKMPRLKLTADWYARLCQACKAGYPPHLSSYNNKFKPRG